MSKFLRLYTMKGLYKKKYDYKKTIFFFLYFPFDVYDVLIDQ